MGLGDASTQALARVRGAVGALGCTRSEAVALALLAVGALAAVGALWIAARPAPASDGRQPQTSASAEVPVSDSALAPAPRSSPPAAVVVHVAGEVHRPGVYELVAGARVADAVEAAGGPLPEAALGLLNLAREVADGEQVWVPHPDEAAVPPGERAGGPGQGARPGAWKPDGTLDLNLATAADLEELPGIGPVLAERIIAHREEIGGFATFEDLLVVRGIGQRTLEDLRPLLSV